MMKILNKNFYIIAIGVLFIIQFSQAQEDKKCKLNGKTGRVVIINTDDQNFKQGNIDVENVEEITDIIPGNYYTLTFQQNDNKFVWKFFNNTAKDFDEMFSETTSSPYSEQIALTLKCSDGSTSIFIITINVEDTNDHRPKIEETEYTFIVPNPVPADFDITLLNGNKLIQVTDDDFSVQNIIIETYFTELQIITETTHVKNSKTYTSSLKFGEVTSLSSEESFVIVANNDGVKSASVKIQLKIDENNSTRYEMLNQVKKIKSLL